jgi:phenylpropionate dioxygenase-like ring-hydroxylating dioxygenase large terminal subunit
MYVRNCWYVAAWSHEIEPQALFTRTILNEPILLMRTSSGDVVALDNRCCHRGAPLSIGRREGDCGRCLYHGLKYDPSGACVEIPGQAQVPAHVRVKTYPVVERNRWVFVWMGDPARADLALLPDNSANDSPEVDYLPEYIDYQVNYLWIADNLMDFSHLSYVHEATLGGSPGIAQSKPQNIPIERGLRVIRHVRDVPPAPYHRKFGDFTGNVDRWFHYDFLVPGILLMHSGLKPPGRPWDDFEGALHLRSCQALTPETDDSTHYFFMQGQEFARGNREVTESIRNSLVAAFAEDRAMITAQVELLKRAPMKMIPIHADAGLNQFRALVRRMVEAEAQEQSASPDAAPEAASDAARAAVRI